MGEKDKTISQQTELTNYLWLTLAIWTLVLAGFLFLGFIASERNVKNLATIEATTLLDKDEAFRLWSTSHGGFYVPIDERTSSSPFLDHIPERDIVTDSGKKLTLMNSEYAIRQMNEDFTEFYGITGHLTSLNALRPENAPDKWEEQALEAFEDGATEMIEFIDFEGQPILRQMRPLITKQGCLKCHAHQGYKVGDIRGGVSVTVPLTKYLSAKQHSQNTYIFSFAVLWLLGSLTISLGSRNISKNARKREFAQKKLSELYSQLDVKVKERTNDLNETNKDLQKQIIARSEAEESNKQLALILDGSLNEIYTFNAKNLKFRQINNAAQRNLGYTMSELLNMTPLDIKPNFTNELFEELVSPLRTGEKDKIVFETIHQRKNHSYYNVEVHLQLLNFDTEEVFAAIIMDITERKKADETLKSSKYYVERLTNSITDIIVSVKMPQRIIEWTNKSIELIGYVPSECLNKTTEFLFTDKKSYEEFGLKLKEVIDAGKDVLYTEHLLKRKNGETFMAEVIVSLIRENNEVVNSTSIIRNIEERKLAEEIIRVKTLELEKQVKISENQRLATMSILGDLTETTEVLKKEIKERLKMEKALRESEEHFRLIFRTSPDAITVTRIKDGLMMDVNKGFVNITGFSEKEVIGNTLIDLGIWTDPKDREKFQEVIKEKGYATNLEVKFRLKNNNIIPALVSARPIKLNGVPCLISVGKSIEGIKKAELELIKAKNKAEFYLNISAEVIVSLDTEGNIVILNEGGHKILGYENKSLIGKNWFEIALPKSVLKEVKGVFSKLMKGEVENIENYENEIITKLGDIKTIMWHNTLLKDDLGNITGLISSGKDVTIERATDLALQKSEEQLRGLTNYMNLKYENEKGDFSRKIHDGLGQLLTGLKMDMLWIERKYAPENELINNKFNSIISNLNEGIKEVQDLAINLRPKMLDDLGLLDTITLEAQLFERTNGIACNIQFIPTDFELNYHMSSTLYRIIKEMFSNTYNHAKATEVELILEKQKKVLLLSYKDNGKGITKAQVNNEASFGIISLKQRVKRWNGDFTISGKPNKGTMINISLPL